MIQLFEGARRQKKSIIKSIAIGMVFWILQFVYQYFFIAGGNATSSVISSTAFASAMLIGLALLTGPLSRLTRYNYVQHRRTMGVLGFTFGAVHMLSVLITLNFDVSLFIGQSPFVQPIIFGFIAFWIYVPVYVTSTDWAAQKMGFRKWKAVHRLVYLAWIATVLHYVLINPPALNNIAGYALLALTGLVFAFELAAFIVHPSRGKNTAIGMIIALIGTLLFYYAKNDTVKYGAVFVVVLAAILVAWKKFNKKPAAAPETQKPVDAPTVENQL